MSDSAFGLLRPRVYMLAYPGSRPTRHTQVVKPKQEKLTAAQEQLKIAEAALAGKIMSLNVVVAKVQALHARFRAKQAEKEQYEVRAARCVHCRCLCLGLWLVLCCGLVALCVPSAVSVTSNFTCLLTDPVLPASFRSVRTRRRA